MVAKVVCNPTPRRQQGRDGILYRRLLVVAVYPYQPGPVSKSERHGNNPIIKGKEKDDIRLHQKLPINSLQRPV